MGEVVSYRMLKVPTQILIWNALREMVFETLKHMKKLKQLSSSHPRHELSKGSV